MTLDDAVKLWVNRDFANIPTQLVKKAFKDNYDELELLSSKYPELDYPAAGACRAFPLLGTGRRITSRFGRRIL